MSDDREEGWVAYDAFLAGAAHGREELLAKVRERLKRADVRSVNDLIAYVERLREKT